MTEKREPVRWDGRSKEEKERIAGFLEAVEDALEDRASGRAVELRHELGGDFALDAPETVEAIWGEGDQVLAAEGEELMIVGPIGTGKSTIAQQLVLHAIGIRGGPFLGHPVSLPAGVIGYIAADRPAQVRRSLRRMVSEADREALNDRLDVWRGALPFALDAPRLRPGAFADFVEARGWSTVVIDSLKDVCSNTTDDEAGLRTNQQIQEAVNRGIAVIVLHHQRKSSDANRRPRKLDDVYGSRWLTAGAGSVLMLWGEAGDEVVELAHLKQPVEKVGPLTLRHDHATGTTTRDDEARVTLVRGGRTNAQKVREALPGTLAAIVEETGLSESTVKRTLRDMGESVESSRPAGNEPAVWSAR